MSTKWAQKYGCRHAGCGPCARARLAARSGFVFPHSLPQSSVEPPHQLARRRVVDCPDKHRWFQKKDWQDEIKRMLAAGLKYELDALANKDFRYLTKTYLPRKLKEEDWLD